MKGFISWFRDTFTPRARTSRPPPRKRTLLDVERLEDRIVPVLGALSPPPVLQPGSWLDGVVNVSVAGGHGTGSLLYTGGHVLTAAHVVADNSGVVKASSILVRFDVAGGPPITFQVPATNIQVHPGFTSDGYDTRNDIAVIILPEEAPAGIPRYGLYTNTNEVGYLTTIAGYGLTGTGSTGEVAGSNSGADKRQGYNVFDGVTDDQQLVITFDRWNEYYGGNPWWVTRDEVGVGHGDSGGPAFLNGQIAGIAAQYLNGTGINGTGFGTKVGFTRVSSYVAWIHQVIDYAHMTLDMNQLPWGNDGQPDTIQALVSGTDVNLVVNGLVVQSQALSGTSLITIIGSGDSDIITVSGALSRGVQVEGGGGFDQLIVDDSGADPVMTRDRTTGALTAQGSVDYTLSGTELDREGARIFSIGYTGVEDLTVKTSHANSKINIDGLLDTPVTLRLGSGGNLVSVGADTSSLQDADTNLTIVGGSGYDSLRVIDSSSFTGGPSYTLTAGSLTRVNTVLLLDETFRNYTTTIKYTGQEKLELAGSNRGGTYQVQSIAKGTAVTITGGTGKDTFLVGDALGALAGALDINGIEGGDTLTFDDTGELPILPIASQGPSYSFTARFWTSSLTRSQWVLHGVDQPWVLEQVNVVYAGISDVTLKGANVSSQYNIEGIASSVDVLLGRAISLNVVGGAGDDVVAVLGTDADTKLSITAGGGDDTINVGNNTADPAQSTLDGIQGALIINDETDWHKPTVYDINTINIYDQGNTAAGQIYSFSNDTLQRAGAAPIIYGETYYDTINLYTGSGGNHVTVNGGPAGYTWTNIYGGTGNDRFDVLATNWATFLGCYSNGGSDLFRVGSASLSATDTAAHGGTLRGLLDGQVAFYTNEGTAKVVIDDAGDTSPLNAEIAANAFFPGHANVSIRYSGYAADTFVHGGSGGNTFDLFSFAAWGGLQLFAGTGSDTINLEQPDDYPYWYHQVAIYGQGGTDTLNVNDQAATDNPTWTIASSALTRTSRNPAWSWDSIVTVNHETVEKVAVNAGSGNDSFVMRQGLAGVSMAVDGGAGANTLDYSAYTTAVTVNLTSGAATDLAGGIRNLQNVSGGAGNDVLLGNNLANIFHGNAGNDLISGLDGIDQIFGGAGRDILIGGKGADQIFGDGGDDILIGGTTKYDTNTAALLSLMQEWSRTDASYATRVANLRKPNGGRNGAFYLASSASGKNPATVFDDGALDSLFGGTDTNNFDWFFGKTSEAKDRDATAKEALN